MKRFWYILGLLSVFTIAITINNMNKAPKQSIAIAQEQSLPVIGSVEKLRSILETVEISRAYMGEGVVTGAIAMDNITNSGAVKSADPAPAASSIPLGGNTDFSATNIQVTGVDEADIVKNDGKYIYQVNNQELIITQADPSDQMKIVQRISFKESEFSPRELFVDDQHLILIGNAGYQEVLPANPAIDQSTEEQSKSMIYPPIAHKSTVKAIIYDLADKSNLTKIREVELDGDYISSRKIGSTLYLMANKYLNTYQIMNQGLEPSLPSYRDTLSNEEFVSIDYPNIHYFPNFIEPNYLLIASLNLDQKDQEMKVSSYLGSGQNIYASTSNLYVAVTQYERIEEPSPLPQAVPNSSVAPAIGQIHPSSFDTATALYRFSLDQDGAEFKAQGSVPGTILNQFSMDEYNGHFRIATTKGQIWRSDENTSKNNVYILDQTLQLLGKIEDIAPGERIYSVRFMGDRGYMVTFKNVDPFFVLDLKDPVAPKILGALKIPGYSDYLHPYDENHIIGFGKETVELSQTNDQGILPGTPRGSNAYYLGMKLAVFDVTDVSNPVEMFKTTIGDRGTDSEVLHNQKALLFNKDTGLLSFPVTLMEVKNPVTNPSVPQYGTFSFQGAYVYHFDLNSGFTLRGKISHLEQTDLLKAGQQYYGSKSIERILYIKNTLYTVSKGVIKANDLASLQEKNRLILNP
ncbi:beta-propeller domain-containing protein [Desulfosporosinus nitroreducens]|uniref:beta-propeller domain-containing protein n=1 Tax=Desulfosporosinus nitroreducens TaxID=2018668 RepID=UPI00207C4901|nr:beta-propeller domain-containing protein [Desulfosporosinus nitroreducens]MCO1602440.1 beta-propeller domain-containing protein [Desulfosporosinus nitroreducens]